MIELATYDDSEYGLVTQFITEKRDVIFFRQEIVNGMKQYYALDETQDVVLTEKKKKSIDEFYKALGY